MSETILEFDGVTRRAKRSDASALESLSFTLARGEVLSILQMTAWERQMLIDLSGGLESPTSGSVSFQGVDLSTLSEKELNPVRGRMGIATSPPVFLNNLRIMDNLRLPQRYHSEAERKTIDPTLHKILGALGVHDFRDIIPSNFGQRFLGVASVARALSNSPDLLIIDRPLELIGRRRTRILAELWKAYVLNHGGAVLLLTQTPRLASKMADRIALFESGRIESIKNHGYFQATVETRVDGREK